MMLKSINYICTTSLSFVSYTYTTFNAIHDINFIKIFPHFSKNESCSTEFGLYKFTGLVCTNNKNIVVLWEDVKN